MMVLSLSHFPQQDIMALLTTTEILIQWFPDKIFFCLWFSFFESPFLMVLLFDILDASITSNLYFLKTLGPF